MRDPEAMRAPFAYSDKSNSFTSSPPPQPVSLPLEPMIRLFDERLQESSGRDRRF